MQKQKITKAFNGIAGVALAIMVIAGGIGGVFEVEKSEAASYTFVEDFTQYDTKIFPIDTGDWSTIVRLPTEGDHYAEKATVQSLKINTTSKKIIKAKLEVEDTATGNMGIVYKLSADGGAHWIQPQLDGEVSFSYPGYDLRWRAYLWTNISNNQNTPVISKVTISYETEDVQSGSLYISTGSNNPLNNSTIEKGAQDASLVEVKFAADDTEDLVVSSLTFGGSKEGVYLLTKNDVSRTSLYDGTVKLGTAYNNNGKFNFSNISIVIPKNSSKSLMLKGDIPDKTDAKIIRVGLNSTGEEDLLIIGVDSGIRPTISGNAPGSFLAFDESSTTIISPNGGEKWTKGSVHHINYISTGHAFPGFAINLWKGEKFYEQLILTDQSKYSWTIPTNLPDGNDYRIEVKLNACSHPDFCPDLYTASDISSYFSIVSSFSDYACTDSDGGKDYYVKGKATGLYGLSSQTGWIFGEDPNKASARSDKSLDYSIYYDHCYDSEDSNQLNEAYCDGNGRLQSYGYTCPNGCKDGACIKDEEGEVCGNGICETGETPETCPQDCAYELFPYKADVPTCTGSDGKVSSTTGKNSVDRFVWNGCTHNKYYNVNSGDKLILRAHTDSCSSCVCYHPNFYIYEYENNIWVKKEYFNLPDKKGITETVFYTPTSDKIKIYAPNCFYLNVYSVGFVEEDSSVISPTKSTITAFPTSIPADGTSFSTITATVKDVSDNSVSGKTVTFLSNRSDFGTDVNSTYTAVSDSSGEAKIKVSSAVVGTSTYTAVVDWNKRLSSLGFQGTTLTQKAKVTFTKISDCLPDGTLIKLPGDPRIYVIENCKKKWIKTAREFQQKKYDWSDVKETSSEVINAYADYLEATAKLLRGVGHHKVYRIVNGKRLWIPTISAFNAQGLKWDEIEDASETEVNQYPEAKLLQVDGDSKIYYLTESGLKRHIPSSQVFLSYGNSWNDVIKISNAELNAYSDNVLIKAEGDYKVYKLENGNKKWIKTAIAFNRLGYDWLGIGLVNGTEINSYPDGGSIEQKVKNIEAINYSK